MKISLWKLVHWSESLKCHLEGRHRWCHFLLPSSSLRIYIIVEYAIISDKDLNWYNWRKTTHISYSLLIQSNSRLFLTDSRILESTPGILVRFASLKRKSHCTSYHPLRKWHSPFYKKYSNIIPDIRQKLIKIWILKDRGILIFKCTWAEGSSNKQHPLQSLCFSKQSINKDGRPVLSLAETLTTSQLQLLNWISWKSTESKGIHVINFHGLFCVFLNDMSTNMTARTLIDWYIFHFPVQLLNGIQRKLTGSKYSTTFTEFVFFGPRPILQQRWPPLFCKTEVYKTLHEASTQRPLPSFCFSGRSVNKSGHPGLWFLVEHVLYYALYAMGRNSTYYTMPCCDWPAWHTHKREWVCLRWELPDV